MTADIAEQTRMLEAAERHQADVLCEIAEIKEQIARAKAKAADTGDYSDTDWFHRANRALRHKQIQHQELLQRAAKLRKQLKADEATADKNRFERAFITSARSVLDETTYHTILHMAITQSKLKGGET